MNLNACVIHKDDIDFSLTLYSEVNVLLRRLADTEHRAKLISTFTVNLKSDSFKHTTV